MTKYYTLVEFDPNHDAWCIAFGDYDRQTVVDEMNDYRSRGANHGMTIITTSDKQDDIDAKIAEINLRYRNSKRVTS